MSSRDYEAKWLWPQFGFASHLGLIACFITYEKWVQREKYPNNTRLPYIQLKYGKLGFKSKRDGCLHR